MTALTTRTNRLENRFKQLKAQGRAGLVTFVTAGDPDLETAQKILDGLSGAGADVIELGMPFSDPMADGPAIQLANLRALKKNITLQKTLDMVSRFRQNDDHTPVVLMGYYNPIHHYGTQRFLDTALSAGVDGLIVVDLPPEEDDELCHPALTAGLSWVRLATPTTTKTRLPRILKNSSGFIYYVSITGITGTRSAQQSDIKQAIEDIRKQTALPIAVGFGIKTAEQVRQVSTVADAVVVGSALVNRITEGVDTGMTADEIIDNVHGFVGQLAAGIET